MAVRSVKYAADVEVEHGLCESRVVVSACR
jgi:hypothetical protein